MNAGMQLYTILLLQWTFVSLFLVGGGVALFATRVKRLRGSWRV